MGRLDNETTCILGHTRWKTRGSEENSFNNQPLRAGRVIGCHNGTILNADRLFKRYGYAGLPRPTASFSSGSRIKRKASRTSTVCVRDVRGGMSAVFTRTSAPDTILVIKGNKPLTMWYHKDFRAVFYSSEEWPLEKVIGTSRSIVRLDIELFTLSVFNVSDLMDFRQTDVYFSANKRSGLSWISPELSSMELF